MLDNVWPCCYYAFTSYLVVRLLKFLFIIAKCFCVHVLTPVYNLDHLKDSWTVVTGCTDGIGRAYIEELAKTRGIRRFYLIGRNRQKLEAVVTQMVERYNAICKTAVFDFEYDDYSKLPQELKTLEMIEFVLPGMIQRNRGCIVNISSMTGWRPLPYLSTYPASKAAIAFFSDSLSDEFRHTKVRIQCLIPLLVATKAASYETTDANNLFIISPEDYAKQAVRAIGRFEILTGCIQHDIQIAFGTLLSFWVFKMLYVPLVILGIHKDRVAAFQKNHQKQN